MNYLITFKSILSQCDWAFTDNIINMIFKNIWECLLMIYLNDIYKKMLIILGLSFLKS